MGDVLARCLSVMVMEIEVDLRQRKANVAHLQKRPKGQSREVQDSQPSFVDRNHGANPLETFFLSHGG